MEKNDFKDHVPLWEEINNELFETRTECGSSKASVREALDSVIEAIEPVDMEAMAGAWGKDLRRSDVIYCVISHAIAMATSFSIFLCSMVDTDYVFTGGYWHRFDRVISRAFFAEAGFRMGIRQSESHYHRFVDDLGSQFRSLAATQKTETDRNRNLINYQNGTLEIRDDGHYTLREHRSSDLLAYQLPFDYDEQAKCERFNSFLDQVLPHPESQANVQEFVGSVFTQFRHEKALMLLGDGHNGKSVLSDVIENVLGSHNVTHVGFESLNSDSHLASLDGHLLNYSSEISGKLRSDRFKKLISGEPIDVRKLYHNPYIMRDHPRFAFNCNELPRDVEYTEAYFRRFLIIPFKRKISEEERNPNLAKELVASEAPGIVNWVLEGLVRLVQNEGFTPNMEAQAALEEYKLESNTVALFADESGLVRADSDNDKVRLGDLHSEYNHYCKNNGYQPVSARTLRKRLNALGFGSKRTNRGQWIFARRESITDDEKSPF